MSLYAQVHRSDVPTFRPWYTGVGFMERAAVAYGLLGGVGLAAVLITTALERSGFINPFCDVVITLGVTVGAWLTVEVFLKETPDE